MLPSMSPPRGAGRRLSVDDWIQAGFAILAEGDPGALRIDRLCESLASWAALYTSPISPTGPRW
jgi:hypothetical protein